MSKPEVERQKSPNLGFWGRIGLESLWIFCKFFSILPYWFRYYVVEPAVFGALRLLRYRYRVVTENLRNSFPEKSLEELHAIRRGFTVLWRRFSWIPSVWPDSPTRNAVRSSS